MKPATDTYAMFDQSLPAMPESVTDEWLMEVYLKGQQSALTMLMKRYEREMYSYLRRIVGDAYLAEDVFPEHLCATSSETTYVRDRPIVPPLALHHRDKPGN